MWSRLQWLTVPFLRKHRGLGRLNSHTAKARLALFDYFAHACNRSTCTDPADKNVTLAICIAPDLFCSRAAMHLRICRILELLRHKRIRITLDDVLCSPHRTRHAFG